MVEVTRVEESGRVDVPLLSAISQDALDADYEHVAAQRARAGHLGHRSGPEPPHRAAVAMAVLFGLLLGVAAIQTARNAGTLDASRTTLIARISAERAKVATVQRSLADLRQDRSQLTDLNQRLAAEQQQGVERLRLLEDVTGAVPTSGAGVRIVVRDGEASTDGEGGALVRDVDLRLLVDGLWQAGAQAIAINGERLTALSAIRNVDIAVHVNNRPLSPPYTVVAVADDTPLRSAFLSSARGQEWLALVARWGFSFQISEQDALVVPGASLRAVRAAVVEASAGASPASEGSTP